MQPAVAQANAHVACVSNQTLLWYKILDRQNCRTKLKFVYAVHLITFVIRGGLEGQRPTQLYNVFAFYVTKAGVHMLTRGYTRRCFQALQHEVLADVWQKLQTVAILKRSFVAEADHSGAADTLQHSPFALATQSQWKRLALCFSCGPRDPPGKGICISFTSNVFFNKKVAIHLHTTQTRTCQIMARSTYVHA